MVQIPFRLVVLSSFILAATAADVRGKVLWNEVCPGYRELGPSKVILDTGLHSGGIMQDGSFIMCESFHINVASTEASLRPDVPAGTYLLQVLSHDHSFDQLRIDVHPDAESEARHYTPGTPFNPASPSSLSYPIEISAKQRYSYFVPPESFNLIGMLRSPMVLLMIFGGGMMLAMPYMMQNMDPESLEEFKDQQAKLARVQSAMATGDLKSGFSALMSGGDESSTTPSPKTQVSNKSKGNKKRR
ncbi:hypothetical protein C8J56DRAFT_1041439 [Mycena floridula]|nr:hypothetical protein C8J56DRAFT_1041439 [Mycena floridula]